MKLVDVKPNMTILATRSRLPCWVEGQEFIVRKTGANELAIECQQAAKHGVHPLRTDAETADFEAVA